MQLIYNAVMAQLKAKTSLQWIDLDTGQLDVGTRPPVAYPCGLIDIEIISCENVSSKSQLCTALVSIRVASDIYAETSADAPDDIRADALSYFDNLTDVFVALQGYSDTNLDLFTRKTVRTNKRVDGLKDATVVFETSFKDYSAAPDEIAGWS